MFLKAPPKGKNADAEDEEEEGEDYDAKIVSYSNYILSKFNPSIRESMSKDRVRILAKITEIGGMQSY